LRKINEFRSMLIDFSKYDIKKAREMARESGKSAVALMQANIHKYDLVDRGTLLKSIRSAVLSKDGEVDRLQFTYEWYGKFQQMGEKNAFGKGVYLKAKNWRNSAIDQVRPELLQKFADYYAQLIVQEIEIDSSKMKM
jgi:hypothetical protein